MKRILLAAISFLPLLSFGQSMKISPKQIEPGVGGQTIITRSGVNVLDSLKWTDVSGVPTDLERTSNKVTNLNSPDNVTYPTTKAVNDAVSALTPVVFITNSSNNTNAGNFCKVLDVTINGNSWSEKFDINVVRGHGSNDPTVSHLQFGVILVSGALNVTAYQLRDVSNTSYQFWYTTSGNTLTVWAQPTANYVQLRGVVINRISTGNNTVTFYNSQPFVDTPAGAVQFTYKKVATEDWVQSQNYLSSIPNLQAVTTQGNTITKGGTNNSVLTLTGNGISIVPTTISTGWNRFFNVTNTSGSIMGSFGFFGQSQQLSFGYLGFGNNTYLNPTIKFTNSSVGINLPSGQNNMPLYNLDVRGNAAISDLSGTGVRMVTADADGVLSTQDIPAAQTLSISGQTLSISDGNSVTLPTTPGTDLGTTTTSGTVTSSTGTSATLTSLRSLPLGSTDDAFLPRTVGLWIYSKGTTNTGFPDNSFGGGITYVRNNNSNSGRWDLYNYNGSTDLWFSAGGSAFRKVAATTDINNNALIMSTGTGLTGSQTFTANSSTDKTFTVGIAGGYKLPTTAEWAAKYNVPTGTTSQYIRGDGSLATFPAFTNPNLHDVLTNGNDAGGEDIVFTKTIGSDNTKIGYLGGEPFKLTSTNSIDIEATGGGGRITLAAESNFIKGAQFREYTVVAGNYTVQDGDYIIMETEDGTITIPNASSDQSGRLLQIVSRSSGTAITVAVSPGYYNNAGSNVTGMTRTILIQCQDMGGGNYVWNQVSGN